MTTDIPAAQPPPPEAQTTEDELLFKELYATVKDRQVTQTFDKDSFNVKKVVTPERILMVQKNLRGKQIPFAHFQACLDTFSQLLQPEPHAKWTRDCSNNIDIQMHRMAKEKGWKEERKRPRE